MAKSKKSLYGYVTSRGEVVTSKSLLAAMKATGEAESKQVDESGYAYETTKLVQPVYKPEALAHLLGVSTWHSVCCSIIAEDVAGNGMELHPKRDLKGEDGEAKEPDEAQRKKVEEFLENMAEPVEVVLAAYEFDRNAIGYATLEMIRDDSGKLADLGHVPAQTVRIHRDKKKYAQQRNGKTVWFSKPGEDRVTLKNGDRTGSVGGAEVGNDLIFDKQYHPDSTIYGLPRVIPALGAIYGEVARQEHNNSFFKNHGIPAYAIFVSGDYDPGPEDPKTGRTELQDVIESHLNEIQENPESVLVLTVPSRRRPDGSPGSVEIKIEKLGSETKEASFAKFRKDNRDEILAAHGVPAQRAGASEAGGAAGGVSPQATEDYKRSVVDPRQRRLERRVNNLILRDELGVTDYELRFVKIDTQDEKADAEVAVVLFGMGAITPNQLIRHFGRKFALEPSKEDGMDDHYIGGKSVEKGQVFAGTANVPGVNPGSLGEDDPARDGPAPGTGGEGNTREQVRQWYENQTDLPRGVRDMMQSLLGTERP